VAEETVGRFYLPLTRDVRKERPSKRGGARDTERGNFGEEEIRTQGSDATSREKGVSSTIERAATGATKKKGNDSHTSPSLKRVE